MDESSDSFESSESSDDDERGMYRELGDALNDTRKRLNGKMVTYLRNDPDINKRLSGCGFECHVYRPRDSIEKEQPFSHHIEKIQPFSHHEHWNYVFSTMVRKEHAKPNPGYVWALVNQYRTGITLFAKHPNEDYMASLLSCYIASPKEKISETLPNILVITCACTLKKYDNLNLPEHMINYVIETLLLHSDKFKIGWIVFLNPGENPTEHQNYTIEQTTMQRLVQNYGFLALNYNMNAYESKDFFLEDSRTTNQLSLFAYPFFLLIQKDISHDLMTHKKHVYGIHISTFQQISLLNFKHTNIFEDHNVHFANLTGIIIHYASSNTVERWTGKGVCLVYSI